LHRLGIRELTSQFQIELVALLSLNASVGISGQLMEHPASHVKSCAELLDCLPDDILARILSCVPRHIGLSINQRCRTLSMRHICSVAPRNTNVISSPQQPQPADPLDPHINDDSLKDIIDLLRKCPRLHTVKLLYLTSRPNIAALTELPQIRELELGTISTSQLPMLAGLTQLTALSVANCRGIASLDFVSGLRSLQEITLSHSHSLEVASPTCHSPF
jgi:hypothetical protein